MKPTVRVLAEVSVRDGLLVTHRGCASPEMATCLVEGCIASLWEEFSLGVVEIVLDEEKVPCICQYFAVVRNSSVEVTSAAPCFCLCIRLDNGRRLGDCVSVVSRYLLEEGENGPYGQEHTSRQRCLAECLVGRGRGRALEEGHAGDRLNARQDGRCRLRSGRSRGR